MSRSGPGSPGPGQLGLASYLSPVSVAQPAGWPGLGGWAGPQCCHQAQSGVSCHTEKGAARQSYSETIIKVGGEQTTQSRLESTLTTTVELTFSYNSLLPGVREENKQREKAFLRMFCFRQNVMIRHGMKCLIIFWRALTISPSPGQREALIVTRDCQMEIRWFS